MLHAYSPLNAGDGLLVRLAMDLVERALGAADVTVVASDADAFGDPRYVQWRSPLAIGTSGPRRRLAMMSTAVFGAHRSIREAAAEADVIVAVGGAYLRGGRVGEAVKSWGAHLGQLRLAAAHGAKSVYLPQSIGPLLPGYRDIVARLLSRVHRVYARDDRTLADLRRLGNVRRVPDMAILEWARTAPRETPDTLAAPVFVARELDDPGSYPALLRDIADTRRFEWAIQASGGGNDDVPLTRRYAPSEPRPMAQVLAEGTPRVVVSTRLHGSLSALIAGYPTVHLSYERKGWSAFDDLGLPEYVLSARRARASDVLALVDRIEADPAAYWAQLARGRERLQAVSDELTGEIRALLPRVSA